MNIVQMRAGVVEIQGDNLENQTRKLEELLGRSVEEFENSCDTIGSVIESEKKNFIMSFTKYGAESNLSSKLVTEFN